MTALRMCCPHCSGDIRVNVTLEAALSEPEGARGPLAFDPGSDVDAFVIDAIEDRNFSYRTVAEILRDRGITTPRGSKNWHATSVRRLYENACRRRIEIANK